MIIKSPAFSEGGDIPQKYTCDGQDISPQILWEGAPKETKSFVLIMEDPDAPIGTFIHWVIYDIPSNATSLPENIAKKEQIENGAKQGRNDFGRIGYGGPCPPPGPAHRYFFILRALDVPTINLKPGATKSQVENSVKGHILAETKFFGKYSRKR